MTAYIVRPLLRLLPWTALALLVAGPSAMAQQPSEAEVTLDEVVVTAQKREESLQDVPLSVEAVSGAKLADAGIVRLDDLKAYVPNLQMTETGIANNIYIRGIGSGLNHGFEQSVSTYADGVYRGRGHQSRMPFLDLARVEVLRGPQPILFGKNAVAGAVSLVSALPGDEFEGSMRVSRDVENDESIASAVLSGPLGDSFGARGALHYRKSDGYVENLTLGRDEPQRDEFAGRLTFAFSPSERFDATLKVEGGSFDVTGRQVEIFGETPITAAGPFTGLTYSQIVAGAPLPLLGYPAGLPQGTHASAQNNVVDYRRSSSGDSSNLDSREAVLTLNWSFGNGLTLTSVSGYSSYDLDELCDCDFVGATVFNAGITEDYDQVSQELRLASPVDRRLSWIGGLFYQDYSLEETDYLYVPPNSLAAALVSALANAANPRVFTQDSELWSAFAQATWRATERFRLSAGGRYSKEDKSGSRVTRLTNGLGGPDLPSSALPLFAVALGIVPHSVSGERSENNFSPLVNLQYDLDERTLGYLSWARGYKSGGFDARSNKPPSAGGTFEFGDERATTYEVGLKTATDTAQVNVALFYTDYQDLQTSAFDGAIGFNVGNGSAEVKGLEIEGRWQATSRLRVSGSVAVLDFEWTRYFGQCYYGLTPIVSGPNAGNCDYQGYGNQLAPRFTGVVSLDYHWPLSATLQMRSGVDVLHSSDYLTSLTLDPASTQSQYTKLNARLALGDADRRWEVALVGRNLTDKTVVSYSGDTPLSQRLFGARSYYGFVDPPRSLAIEASLRF